MLYLDTHIVVWLYEKDKSMFSEKSLNEIELNDLFVSPIVSLELEYLFESKKITISGKKIIEYLENTINLKLCDQPFSNIIREAVKIKWTRDPFDRIIVANAKYNNISLLTKDKTILSNYKNAIWK